MSFLAPLALLLGLLAVPIIILYMLRLRRQEMVVSSTMLWRKLLRDREANAPWQRLRRNLLLILQLIILGMLVFALARPFLPVPSVISGSVVVLLDGSASMQAVDVAPSRFGAAVEEVEELIGNLGGGDQMTLILVGTTPEVLAAATGDRSVLREALAGAEPSNADADWAAALALAAGAAQGYRDARIAIVSDGGLPADLPPLPGDVVYLPVGERGSNLAVSALATRDAPEGVQLFASVTNYGQLEQETLLSIDVDGSLFDSRRLTVPAGSTTNVTWTVPPDAATIGARLGENGEDFLALDNQAWAVHEGGVSNRVLLVGEGNLFLEQVFSVLPGLEVFKAAPDDDLGTETYDLYIYDGVPLPDPPPPAALMLIDPRPGEARVLTVGEVYTDTAGIPITRLTDTPLLNFVEWGEVNIGEQRIVSAPWAQTLVGSAQGPLVMAGEQGGRRVAVLAFDLRNSDLPLRIAFPILMANITNWLNPGRAFDAAAGLQPGEPVQLRPGAETSAVVVEKPDGTTWRAVVGEDGLIFDETDAPGLYGVVLQDAAGSQPAGQFAVNLFSNAESALDPAASIRLGQQEAAGGAEQEDVGQRELWPWLALLALLVLAAEWWIYHRGPRLPRLRRPDWRRPSWPWRRPTS